MSTDNKAPEVVNQVDVQATATKVIDEVKTLDIHKLGDIFSQWVIPHAVKILLAIAIFVIGRYLARVVSRFIGKMVLASSKDEMLQSFVTSIAYFLFLLISVIASLSQLGINTNSLVALIGAAGLAIGLALQNSLQNFAAGVMILIFKPFKRGDFIEAGGAAGKVEKMGLMMLELRTGDNKTVLVPNGKTFADKITNYSSNRTRRIDFIFDIGYEADIPKAKAIISRILNEDERVLKTPAPTVAVGALAASSVQLFVRPWVRSGDYADVNFAIMERVKLAFDEAGISIPFNQLDLHLPENIEITRKETK